MSQPQSNDDQHDDGIVKLSHLRQKLDPEDRDGFLQIERG